MVDFYKALERTLGFEGGFSDNPNDSGGRTMHGLSEKWFPEAWEDGPPTLSVARLIYREHFWLPLRCNLLNSQNIANELFDTAVNIGLHKAVVILQQSINMLRGDDDVPPLTEDGRIGPLTLKSANEFDNESLEKALFNFMNYMQAARYISLHNRVFLRGWFAHRIGGWVDYE